MNKSVQMTLITVLGVIVMAAFLFGSSYVSANNYGARLDAALKAQYNDMENILGQYSLKLTEAAQVPAMYRDDVQKVLSSAISARYGAGGSKAVFQFLKEQNPSLDVSVYRKVQELVESGRNEFQNAQTKFLDTKRGYEAQTNYFWQGMFLRMAGYPKVPFDAYKLISSEHAQASFKSGVDKAIPLR